MRVLISKMNQTDHVYPRVLVTRPVTEETVEPVVTSTVGRSSRGT